MRATWARVRGPAGRADLVAGLTVGAVVVPQSLAYAELAGMPPVTGLYAALAAMAVYAVLGSSPHASLGPTATSAILAAAAVQGLVGEPSEYPAALGMVAVISGGLALAAGLVRLGFVSNLLSRPVLAGYTAGAAVVIAVGQVATLLGIDLGDAARKIPVHEVTRELFRASGGPSGVTVAVAVASILALVLLGQLVPRLPAALCVVGAGLAASEMFDLQRHGVAVVGRVPGGLPTVAWPDLGWSDSGSLVAAAAALAVVAFAEATAQARALTLEGPPDQSAPTPSRRSAASPGQDDAIADDETSGVHEDVAGGDETIGAQSDVAGGEASGAEDDIAAAGGASEQGPRRDPLDANRELLALGSANVASGLCGAFPVSGSFSRNAVNLRAGGRTRRAGAVSAAVVALVLVTLTGPLDTLPRATLAAVVVVAVASLVPLRTFRRLYRLQRDDFVFAMAALVGTVTLGILPGLAVAVALSIGGLLYRVTVVDAAVLGYVAEEDTWRSLDRHAGARPVPGVVVVRLAGPLYFANAARLHREIAELVAEAPDDLHRVVVDGRAMSHVDVTAMDMLADLHAELRDAGIDLALAGLRGPALDAILRTDLARTVGPANLVYPTVRQAANPLPATPPGPPDSTG